MCIWDGLFLFAEHWLNSDTFPDRHHKHGRKAWWRAATLFVTRSLASHMHLQWHNKDAASRDLWMEIMQVLMLLITEIDGQDLAKVTSKHHPYTFFKSPSHLLLNCSQFWPSSSLQSLSLSSSFITHVPRFSISTAIDSDGLPILRQSTSLF